MLHSCKKQLNLPVTQIFKYLDAFDIKEIGILLSNNLMFLSILNICYNPYTKLDLVLDTVFRKTRRLDYYDFMSPTFESLNIKHRRNYDDVPIRNQTALS